MISHVHGWRAFIRAGALLCPLLMSGCGFEREALTPISVPPTPAEKLEGNWLIYGALPQLYVPVNGPDPTPGLAVSFSSDGKTITGTAFLSGTCTAGGSFNIIFANAITAVPDAAGNFSTSSTGVFGSGFTLTGTAPNLSGKPWSGTYQLTNAGTNNTCAFSASGPFTATSVSQLTGTFAGSATVLYFVGSGQGVAPGASLGISLALTQAAPPLGVNGLGPYLVPLVQGQVTMDGIPCFTHGTIPQNQGTLDGNVFELPFTMDDGSTLAAIGTIDNVMTTHLLLSTVLVSGGNCAGNYYIPVPGAVLSR